MAPDSANPSSARACTGEGRAPACPSLLLWAVLGAALALAFLIDGVAMDALAPLRGSSLAEFLKHTVRWLGTGYVQASALLLVIAVSVLLRLPSLRLGAWALLCFLLSGASAIILKVLVHRARPWTKIPAEGWSDYLGNGKFQSFPSGESTTTFALAMLFGLWYPRWRVPLLAAAAVIAGARVVVGRHYPSDVFAGAMLGIAVAQLVTRLADRRQRRGPSAET